MLSFAILVLGVLTRLIVHIPNFTPVIALSLFSGFYLNKRYAVVVPLALMMISDLIIGWHDTILFTWGSIALIAGIGIWAKRHKSIRVIMGVNIFSAVLFFLITNFGAWLSLYPHTWEGLVACYVAAIPFFRATFFSTIIYGAILFGLYEGIAYRVKNTRFATILLST